MAALTIAQQPNPQMPAFYKLFNSGIPITPAPSYPRDPVLIVPLWLERGPLAVLSFRLPTAPSTVQKIWSHWLSSIFTPWQTHLFQ